MPNPVTTTTTIVRAAARHRWASTISGASFALLGVVTLLVELVRYWMLGHSIHAAPVCIGCLFGFVGFFILNPRQAKEGAGIVVGSTVSVLTVLRNGRRSTDAPVVVATKTEDKP